MGCMTSQPARGRCDCGFDPSASISLLAARPGTVLTSRYLLGRVLGEPGGFGVTYIGWDAQLERTIAIKEFLPRDLAGREGARRTVVPHSSKEAAMFRFGLDRFLDEARTLAKFDNAYIVRVQDFFEANGTAYLVMPYYPGESVAPQAYTSVHGPCSPPPYCSNGANPSVSTADMLRLRSPSAARAAPKSSKIGCPPVVS